MQAICTMTRREIKSAIGLAESRAEKGFGCGTLRFVVAVPLPWRTEAAIERAVVRVVLILSTEVI